MSLHHVDAAAQSAHAPVAAESGLYVAALGGLLFGYDWVVIGGAKPFYEKFFGLTTPAEIGWAMSCALVGCLAGALLSGCLSDRFGRKPMLILSAVVFAASSVGTGLADSFTTFVLNRIAGGVAIGLASNLSPMYIAEIAPAAIRGRLVAINQLTIVIGILAAQILNWAIAAPVPPDATAEQIRLSWNGQVAWRWMFAATAVPSLLFFALMLFAPETPRWLMKKGARRRAHDVLRRIGGTRYADASVDDIAGTLQEGDTSVHWRELVRPPVRGVLLLGIALAVFQQWCGINVVFNYAEEVFSAAGYHVSDILFNIVLTGVISLVCAIIAILTCDHIGRRKLMLFGAAGLAVTYTLIAVGYRAQAPGWLVMLLVLTALASYAVSLAPVTWVIISEIFPNRVRGTAMSIAVGALWAACFALTYTFPYLNRILGTSGTFAVYAAICAVGFVYLKLRLPETKGKTLEEIERALS